MIGFFISAVHAIKGDEVAAVRAFALCIIMNFLLLCLALLFSSIAIFAISAQDKDKEAVGLDALGSEDLEKPKLSEDLSETRSKRFRKPCLKRYGSILRVAYFRIEFVVFLLLLMS